MSAAIDAAFRPGGPLAGAVREFSARAEQREMAAAVGEAIAERGVLVCEAGTGTGKTFAYLVPALLSGRRVILSTGTRNLQDQLFNRDLPLVRAALGVEARVALLKGRSNYLCRERLDRNLREPGLLLEEAQAELAAVSAWAPRTASGDIAGCTGVPEISPIWTALTSTTDSCSGRECAFYEECHVMEARRRAAAADIVVVNHHLLLADMSLREEGFAEVLPSADAIVFDEAHQVPDLAARFFGRSVTGRQLTDLARDLASLQRGQAPDEAVLAEAGLALERLARELRLALGETAERAEWQDLPARERAAADLQALGEVLEALTPALEALAEQTQPAQMLLRRAAALETRLQAFLDAADEEAVRWVETQRAGFALHCTPIDVAAPFQERLAEYQCAQVYTSATLAVGESFEYFCGRLGIEGARTERWDSPFAFERQSLLYLPGLPVQPGEAGYTRRLCEAALPVLEASGGRAFFLFTSHRALREASEHLAEHLPFPILVQGEAPRAELIDRFRSTRGAVLLGSASFWEGVDVRGEALSCVIIDKLPFAVPSAPVLRARARRLEAAGGNAFRELQLPEAVLALKQGIGRLLRDEQDRGVVMIGDPRIRSRPYGRVFLASLPPMPVTGDIQAVRAFFGAASGGSQ